MNVGFFVLISRLESVFSLEDFDMQLPPERGARKADQGATEKDEACEGAEHDANYSSCCK